MVKLITFPGQGTPLSIPTIKTILRKKESQFSRILRYDKNRNSDALLNSMFAYPERAGSIAVCSNLLYQLLQQEIAFQTPALLLGHSLGELTCLSVNSLFSLQDLFDIANYRNDLMVKYTEKYLLAHKLNHSTKFQMWALSSPKAVNLPRQITQLLSSSSSNYSSVAIANSNSVKQCVVTGLIEDLELLRTELELNSNSTLQRLRITELTNPNNLAFHNNTVLRPIQEPLYDFIWQILKKNQTHTVTYLDHPIISNLDGKISFLLHHAIEKFVKCSHSTVQFTSCYDTINSYIDPKTKNHIQEAVCIGPGNVIYNLIKRNCYNLTPFPYSTIESIDVLHEYTIK